MVRPVITILFAALPRILIFNALITVVNCPFGNHFYFYYSPLITPPPYLKLMTPHIITYIVMPCLRWNIKYFVIVTYHIMTMTCPYQFNSVQILNHIFFDLL